MDGPLAFIFIARILRLWKKLNDRNNTQGITPQSTAKHILDELKSYLTKIQIHT